MDSNPVKNLAFKGIMAHSKASDLHLYGTRSKADPQENKRCSEPCTFFRALNRILSFSAGRALLLIT